MAKWCAISVMITMGRDSQTWRDGRGREIPCPYLRRLESSRFGSTDGGLSDDATSLNAAEREGRLWIRHAEVTASPYLRFGQGEGRDHNPASSGQEALDDGTNLPRRQ
jgi:hypothetical protein